MEYRRRRARVCTCMVAGSLVLLCAAATTQAGGYFPERGNAALVQRMLEVEHPSIVMMLSLEPGMEDFPTLAWLRLGTGSRVVSVYATNGETTPSDFSGETPGDLAGRRKMEAVHSMSILDADAYFLNLRDAGVLTRRNELEESWAPDSAVSRIVAAIRLWRPDVIILTRDTRADSAVSLRQRVLQDLLLRAVRQARSAGEEHGPATPLGDRAWNVQRLLVEMGHSAPVHAPLVEKSHPVWNKSYAAIGHEAEVPYLSLRARIGSYWRAGSGRAYTPVSIGPGSVQKSFNQGLLLADGKLAPITRRVEEVLTVMRKGRSAQVLKPLLGVLELVDYTIAKEAAKLSNLNRRALMLWKNSLENLRCTLLDVNIQFEMSDSLLAERQVFFLRFKEFTADTVRGGTKILFPGVGQGDWIVTEGNSQVFPFQAPKEFQVLTPQKMQYSRPAIKFGLRLPTLTTNFSFIIFHRDTVRERSFVYRKEIPLGITPRGTAEVLTPVIRMTAGERLVYAVWNFMRDPLKGDAYVLDSLASAGHRLFVLPRKDQVSYDTLTLNWTMTPPEGDYTMDLMVWDRPCARKIVVRKFDAAADTSRRVGVLTGIEGSPIAEALRRLHVRTVLLEGDRDSWSLLDSLKTIIIDRDAIALRPDLFSHLATLATWARAGGHLVVLSQFESEGGGLVEGVSFKPRPHLEAIEPVVVDTTASGLLLRPNRITSEDWNGWVVSRAMGSIHLKSERGLRVDVRSRDGRVPLLATARIGNGAVTFVALDLSSQLLNVNPGSYRLLANLMSAP